MWAKVLAVPFGSWKWSSAVVSWEATGRISLISGTAHFQLEYVDCLFGMLGLATA